MIKLFAMTRRGGMFCDTMFLMKRFLFLGLVLLFSSPFFAAAQTATERYCPNPSTDFFKGSIYHTDDGKPWIEGKVNPTFERDILRGERKITGDIPLTPVYDLVVRIKPEFNYYCIPGWAGNATEVKAEQMPPFLHVTAALAVGTNDEVVVDPVVFSRTDEKDGQG